ncbi:hypothetical protein GCM10023170_098520 [Phytohabitans houttuyneae]|uniref:Ricin B lectin domain-containing protein n=1 Tax=Phytohabitans houttuyneae TaxID=1076126 RepID=A0A6V8KWW1_9ACTN|nr:hypothetical protein Phou_105160 [Phytohabitans houttuyneae]
MLSTSRLRRLVKRPGRLIAIATAVVTGGALVAVPSVASAATYNTYYIQNAATGQCLEPRNNPASNNIITKVCGSYDSWSFNGNLIADALQVNCLTLNTVPGGVSLRMTGCRPQDPEPRRRWAFTNFDGSPTQILSAATGCALLDSDIPGDTAFCVRADSGNSHQRWRIVFAGTIEIPDNPTG